ncbi:hypothetical protein LCGC14_1956260 [marine sediment metagenome]|uniref:Uncharacterized protein n=1 Tax=marine sediment metagenome TaxID=412755 RepID=A0A0F9ID42_9ZZZZ
MIPDHVNALFEFIGGCMIWMNVVAVYRDRQVAGVRWWTTGFFAAWGGWNIFYYPHLDQWWSFTGGLWIVTANIVWVVMLIHYSRQRS